jgi:streptogramin lyase
MRLRQISPIASFILAAFLLQAGLPDISACAQNAAALSGQVSSGEEGAMEGVLVSARREGSTVTTTVVTDDKGHYAFPAAGMEPGHYVFAIRAIGYKLDGPKSVDVTAATTTDLRLSRNKNLASQLSNGEWVMSLPGADKQKAFLIQCVGCHTLQRVVLSTHDAAEFEQLFKRMSGYSPGSTPVHPQPLLPGPRGERPIVGGAAAKAAAEYLASINLSNAETWEFPLKTLPRPKGPSTRVIFTEYDLPRKEAQPHDVVVDANGDVWYSDFGAQFIGELDPRTGKVTDYPIPVLKAEQPKGSLDLEFDPEGHLWVAMMYQAGITRFDPKTKTAQAFAFPTEWQSASTQASMVSPSHMDVDGKVWSNNQEDHSHYRLEVATGRWENMGEAKDRNGRQISAYGMPTDQQNNVYLLEFGGTSIGRRNAKTNEVTIWPTPFAASRPRRGRIDAQDRLWFAEYGGNGIAMFDPATQKIQEWQLPTAWSAPYDVAPARDGEVWTGSMLNDQVARLDPKTDRIIEYLLPRPTNIRRVFVDSSGERPALWIGSNHGASIIRVEPLD